MAGPWLGMQDGPLSTGARPGRSERGGAGRYDLIKNDISARRAPARASTETRMGWRLDQLRILDARFEQEETHLLVGVV